MNNITEIGDYSVKEEVSKGLYYTLYKGLTKNGEKVLIKFIKKKENMKNQKHIIKKEKHLLQSMKSRYSLNYKDLLEDDDYFYFVTEYCDVDLNEYINTEKSLSFDIIRIILIELNEIFGNMQFNNVIHKNLCPENILLKKTDKENLQIKVQNYILGNLVHHKKKDIYSFYIAPESYIVDEYNYKSDLWTIGMLIYKMLYNDVPFETLDEYTEYINSEGEIPIAIKEIKNENLNDLIRKLLIFSPKERINWKDYYNHPFFKEDSKFGHIKYDIKTYKNGRYEGFFKNDKKDGKGTYYFNDGNKYYGDWVEDVRSGVGIFYYQKGDKYEGEFLDGKKHGKGTYFYSNGDKYEGDFVNDERTGKGKMKYKKGERYEGDFLNGKKHGNGIYIFANGDRYEGEFKNNQIEGKGKFWYESMGDYYEGDFLNGKRHGKGVYKYQSGNIYEGDFVEGRKEGYGIFYFKERNEIETYEGMWLNDMAEGKGSKTLIDGEVMTGIFSKNKLIKRENK